MEATWDKRFAQGDSGEGRREPKQHYHRARVKDHVLSSLHPYPAHKPSLLRKLSEGDGGMIKLTDGINVRQKLRP